MERTRNLDFKEISRVMMVIICAKVLNKVDQSRIHRSMTLPLEILNNRLQLDFVPQKSC